VRTLDELIKEMATENFEQNLHNIKGFSKNPNYGCVLIFTLKELILHKTFVSKIIIFWGHSTWPNQTFL